MLALEVKPDGEGGERIVRSKDVYPSLDQYDLIVVDEGSMTKGQVKDYISDELYFSPRTNLVYMADRYQLPPIPDGRTEFEEQISRIFTEIEEGFVLTKIERQREGSPLADLIDVVRGQVFTSERMQIQKINQFTKNKEEGVWWLDKRQWLEAAIRKFKSQDYKENIDDLRILAWRRKTVGRLNHLVRAAVYGADADEFIVGERIVTNHPVLDVDKLIYSTSEELEIGSLQVREYKGFKIWLMEVRSLDDEDAEPHWIKVLHRDERIRFEATLTSMERDARLKCRVGEMGAWDEHYDWKQSFADVSYVFANTVHKCQSGTFRNAMVYWGDIMANPRTVVRHQCLYTAVSRASHRLLFCE